MKKYLVSTLLALLSMPFLAFAEAPPYVTGLSAEVINGEVHLEWAEQPGADVAYYRVFYSFESILENEGLYDDFEETEGPENFFVFEDPPEVDTLHLAVIGVNPDGEDADLFVEEIAVDLTQGDTGTPPTTTPGNDDFFPPDDDFFPPWELPQDEPPSSLPPSDANDEGDDVLTVKDEELTLPGSEPPDEPSVPQQQIPQLPPPQPTTLKVLLAQATSPTQVSVIFSGPLLVEPSLASQAFSIWDTSGNQLPITQMIIEGPQATVTTVEQTRSQPYEFRMSPPAYSPEGLEMDPVARRATFTGHPQGTAAQPQVQTPPPAPSTPQGPLTGVSNYKLKAMQQPNGLYAVEASWDLVGNPQELAYYIAYQTRDMGQTFGPPEALTANIGGIQIPDVTPGPFGLMLALARTDGMGIQAGFENIMLGGQVQQPTAQVMPPVQTPPTPSYPTQTQPTQPGPAPTPLSVDKLAQTGPMTAILLLGAGGGMIIAGRRKRACRTYSL